jgi:hypothetical protein
VDEILRELAEIRIGTGGVTELTLSAGICKEPQHGRPKSAKSLSGIW